jgi:NAD(P)-dependent dehydrogenase (short-subunit alcohol dehydrogenase family)
VLVKNASSLGPTPLALLGDTECEDVELALSTNLLGPFRLTKALLGALGASAREGGGAVVLNVSSDAAVNAYPSWGAYGVHDATLGRASAALEARGYRTHEFGDFVFVVKPTDSNALFPPRARVSNETQGLRSRRTC